MEERARRLLAEREVTAASPQATGTFSPSVLPPPPTHTTFDLTFKSPVAPPPQRNTPRRCTPSFVTPVAHRWVPVSCLPATTHEVNYAFMPSGPAYSSDLSTSTVTYTVPSLPPVALSLEPLPSVSASKAQPVVPPPVVNSCTSPAPVATQLQVGLVKQFQSPKPYSGVSSWKGSRVFRAPGCCQLLDHNGAENGATGLRTRGPGK